MADAVSGVTAERDRSGGNPWTQHGRRQAKCASGRERRCGVGVSHPARERLAHDRQHSSSYWVLSYVVQSYSGLDHSSMPSPSPKYALDPALLSLGQAVRSARKARGISQEQLALASQVERSYMSSIERGMQNVGVMTLVRISATLGLTVADLMAQAHL